MLEFEQRFPISFPMSFLNELPIYEMGKNFIHFFIGCDWAKYVAIKCSYIKQKFR